MKKNQLLPGLLLVCAALLLSACSPITIARIRQDPSRYRNREIQVHGTVITSVGVLSRGGYEIDDGTGRIFVISDHGIPARGARVTVKGTVFSGAAILGQNVGVAIRETEHKVR